MLPLSCVLVLAQTAAANVPDLPELEKRIAQFAPVEIKADVSKLPPNEKAALAKLVEAARVMDGIFLDQVWAGNKAMLLDLAAERASAKQAERRLSFFLINKGPWDRIAEHEPFVPGVSKKPGGAGFYPEDATKQEIEAWLAKLPDVEKVEARGFFTVIKRAPNGFISIPYALEYQNALIRASRALSEAAKLTTQPTLKRFLETRAKAFLTDDYYESDVAWMELDASIEPTIGPYEVYEDEWFNAKAAYEAFIALRDDAATEKLAKFGGQLQDIEDHLPIEPALRNPKLGALAPIRVVNVVLTAGDANRGVQTAAFNLPNDERVIKEKGSKRVMLKNVQEAKFERVLLPISKVALSPADQKHVQFDAFFTHILMHELMHGLGPHNIQAGGKASTVRAEMKDLYSAIEEAKADISGLWALQYLVDKGVIDRSMESTMYVTYLASAFRSIRFGIGEAHGKGIAIQLNHLLDHGGFKVGADGRFSVDPAKIKPAVAALTTEIMTLQAKGDYAGAKAMVEKLGVVRPQVKAVLDKLSKVPIDIAPRFTTAESLISGS